MTKLILLSAVIIGFLSCGQPKKKNRHGKVADTYQPAFTTTQLNNQFALVLKPTKPNGLEKIFADWNSGIKPNTEEFIDQNDTITAVFAVYKTFYKPFDLLKLGQWEWGNDLNSKCKYAVVQNKIFYAIVPSGTFDGFDQQKTKPDSILNFRPPVDLDQKKVLYLTDEYAKSINKFLGTESTEVGEGNVMNPSMPKGESEKRYELLRPYIPILHGHWGEYWHLETHPQINMIVFNPSLTKATISFRVGYQGGEATLEKSAGSWSIKESKATWIE